MNFGDKSTSSATTPKWKSCSALFDRLFITLNQEFETVFTYIDTRHKLIRMCLLFTMPGPEADVPIGLDAIASALTIIRGDSLYSVSDVSDRVVSTLHTSVFQPGIHYFGRLDDPTTITVRRSAVYLVLVLGFTIKDDPKMRAFMRVHTSLVSQLICIRLGEESTTLPKKEGTTPRTPDHPIRVCRSPPAVLKKKRVAASPTELTDKRRKIGEFPIFSPGGRSARSDIRIITAPVAQSRPRSNAGADEFALDIPDFDIVEMPTPFLQRGIAARRNFQITHLETSIV
jgi:hypothetical protein